MAAALEISRSQAGVCLHEASKKLRIKTGYGKAMKCLRTAQSDFVR
jgi:hypothetical protein